ncbi:hypothetical protein C8P63_1273 [Melghirimyces profundicolus]|uniref:Tfp pilus assembly protein PilN n=1 Tax=Melghirimyces profundicolus TaxID=1242148 RepID=A0A2T6BCA9_9BACL|nr:hypothetical protein [Melghirimyces profundicolus]PTX53683.1 hypothetical protein C8P63_1273 [Melghirimyces profundicolus]
MPPVPPGRRYFGWGLVLILCWLVQLTALAGWFFTTEFREAARMQETHQSQAMADLKAREKVGRYQEFMKRYGPEVRYRQSVQKAEEGRVLWSDGLRVVNEKLPAGTELFRSEAEGRRMDGWAVFPSGSEAAVFLESLKQDARVDGVFLDCLGKSCGEDALPEPPAKGEQVLHFHFTLKPSSEEKRTEAETASPAPEASEPEGTPLPEVGDDVE